ncbi:hypothetical protein [Streptomyces sp. NPDC059928]|uniref:hypothetical protein n=1 Tax=unclassified Streptomyces TaxID=2593676 RepID=UPI003647EBA1
MTVAAVGFRRANQTTGRQITVVVTQSGFLHKNTGPLGRPGRFTCPRDVTWFPPGPNRHPVQKAVAELRRLHNQQQHAYARTMIAPAAVRLEDGTDEASSTDVITAFTGAAPSGERALEDAIAAFYRDIGAPTRPAPRIARAWRTTAPHTPRTDQYLRVLAQEHPLTHGATGAGYTITPHAVRLHYTHSTPLVRAQVLDPHAALTAWLRLHPDET